MFHNCFDLNNLNISSFNTKNVTDMSYMFYDCKNLINLDLSSFNTKNIENVNGIFHGCNKSIIEKNKSIFNIFNENDFMKEFIQNNN